MSSLSIATQAEVTTLSALYAQELRPAYRAFQIAQENEFKIGISIFSKIIVFKPFVFILFVISALQFLQREVPLAIALSSHLSITLIVIGNIRLKLLQSNSFYVLPVGLKKLTLYFVPMMLFSADKTKIFSC